MYCSDVFQRGDYLYLAQFFDDMDLNEDGIRDFGSCVGRAPGGAWRPWVLASVLCLLRV